MLRFLLVAILAVGLAVFSVADPVSACDPLGLQTVYGVQAFQGYAAPQAFVQSGYGAARFSQGGYVAAPQAFVALRPVLLRSRSAAVYGAGAAAVTIDERRGPFGLFGRRRIQFIR